MPQSTCRAAGQSRGMGLMTVSTEQGPATCHDLVRLSAFFPVQLFQILVMGTTCIASSHSIPHPLKRFSESYKSHLIPFACSITGLDSIHPLNFGHWL
jgi:hypothetical protein